MATPDELLGYKFVQEAVEELEAELPSEARPSCLEPGTPMVSEAAPPAPAIEDAESIGKRRRLIDRQETTALRRFYLVRQGPRMTRHRGRSPLREEDSIAPPADGKAAPDDKALSP